MKKITIIIVCAFLVSGIVFVLLNQRPKNSVSPNTQGATLPTGRQVNNAPTIQLKTYANESGFSFKYPEPLTLSEKEVDKTTYALVELANPKNKEIISIKLEDSDLAKIDDWFTILNKKDIQGEIKKIKLADLDGRQFINNDKQLVTLALDKGGVLISISGNPTSLHQQIVSSFVFTQSAQSTTTTDSSDSTGGGGGDVIFEGEETIE